MSQKKNADDSLADVARAIGVKPAKHVIVCYRDGSKYCVPIPECEEVAPDEWPPASGWGFRPGLFSLDGEVYKLGGKSLECLILLAGRDGSVTVDELREMVWCGDRLVGAQLITNQVYMLRKRLVKLLGLTSDFNPIVCDGGTYRLVI